MFWSFVNDCYAALILNACDYVAFGLVVVVCLCWLRVFVMCCLVFCLVSCVFDCVSLLSYVFLCVRECSCVFNCCCFLYAFSFV